MQCNDQYNLNQEKVKYSKSIESESEMIIKRKSAFKSFNTLVINSPLFLVGQGDFWHLRRRHQHTLEILQFKQTLQISQILCLHASADPELEQGKTI